MGIGFGVMLLRDNKVLLGQRHSDPIKADSAMRGEGTWTMPGGKLDFGESFEEGARRELLEETGLKLSSLDDLRVISLSNDIVSDAHFVTIGMLCKNISGNPKVMEPDEITKWDWFPLDQLPKPLFPPSATVIRNYNEGIIYSRQ